MPIEQTAASAPTPLRLWPGVLIVIVQWLGWFVVPLVIPGAGGAAVMFRVAGGLAMVVWWLFFSRARWSERIGALVMMIVATVVTRLVVDRSMAGGMMGMLLPIYAVPITLAPAFVAWAVATRRLSAGVRRATMVATIVLACGFWTLVRTDGIKGEADAQLAWRWTPTPEQRLLARANDEPTPIAPAPAAAAPTEEPPASEAAKPLEPTRANTDAPPEHPAAATAPAPASVTTGYDWPGFRGPERDSVVRGLRIETGWSSSPPVKLWQRPIGPGWSSFAVHGDLIYTQEQRGEEEVVSCYRLTNGEPVWRHRDAVRFYESNGGAGPRGTPTVSNGRVYSFGATGLVNALDARTGAVVWSRNAMADTGVEIPGWGFASSPLVVGDAVIVAASGRLVAYDVNSGNPRWVRKTVGGGYSSPHPLTIDGVVQVLLLSGGGATSVAPADGAVLWQHPWVDGVGIVQPAVAVDGDLLIAAGDSMGGAGVRRLHIAHTPDRWTVEERWTSRGLKPYFNDFVVHNGHAYGFDGTILACIDLTDGTRKWKGGRYGAGQLLLLADQDVLLVLSEEGELALVKATPDQFTELARIPALEGKTWNHPVLVGNILLVRNGEAMAAFRLPLATGATQ